MAGRQNKVNIDYFELDCHMDEKVRLIQAEYGLKGFAVFVKLLQEIYGGYGYYCEWTQDRELLFASENGLSNGSLQLLKDIVAACIRRNIFSERLFTEYGILTSSGVQKQYLKATVKREVVELKKEYLLISIPQNTKNVVINSISDGINSISDIRNTQSRVEQSKEENIKECANAHKKKFIPPTVDEVRAYCIDRNNKVDPQTFVDYYTSNGWMVGRNRMKDWKAAVRTWEKNSKQEKGSERKKFDANKGMMRADYGDMAEYEKAMMAN